ncbi:FAD-binding oxidoreductase [Thermoleophilum album]|jgi:FAD/FMN-containing dehydrogenase|uniref:FAD-binding oxidoreductase n=1 Tax=Thermoleophilum album TaxID=29539 RepID=UPI00237C9317|nr:FAD-binding oxidoreductase [Thermoleophilum album]WDT94236.1 FAD-binding oxidoreductase [Thermoleophilum album]
MTFDRRTTGGLESTLRAAVGPAHVIVDPAQLKAFECDWTRRFQGRARAAVLPADSEEVAAVVTAAAEHGVGVVPQGGNTGLVGGSVARSGELVLSLRRLRTRGKIDLTNRTVRVGAGVTLAELDDLARPHGLAAGLDLGARDAASVGGIVACDAGGHNALRYGTARRRVRGLEVALADGSIVWIGPRAPKDNAGYNLVPLLVGSEGTLAVITAVEWELVPRPERRATALLAVDSMPRALEFALALRASVPAVEAIEFMCSASFALLAEQLSLAAPAPLRPVVESGGFALLCEVAGDSDDVERFAAFVTRRAAGERATLASDEAQRTRLWRLRDAVPEAVARAGVAHKIDVALPPQNLDEFDRRLRELFADRFAPPARLVCFGHLGDGNVHVNVLGLPPDCEDVDAAVLELAAACGGTISGEHGIGTAKARYLHLVRSEHEIALMRAIKRAFDPRGVLNPGVLLPEP